MNDRKHLIATKGSPNEARDRFFLLLTLRHACGFALAKEWADMHRDIRHTVIYTAGG